MADLKVNGLPDAPNPPGDEDFMVIGQTGGAATAGVSYKIPRRLAVQGKLAAVPLASAFTLTKGGSTTATLTDVTASPSGNGMLMTVTGSSGVNKTALADKTVPGATWVMTARLRPLMLPGNYRTFGLHVRDNATGKIHMFGFQALSNGYFINTEGRWNPIDSLSSQTNLGAGSVNSGDPCWCKLVLDATNLTFFLSYDGVNYIQIFQLAKFTFVAAITHAGMFFNCRQDATPVSIVEYLLTEEFSLV